MSCKLQELDVKKSNLAAAVTHELRLAEEESTLRDRAQIQALSRLLSR